MTMTQVLCVEDEPDILEILTLALGLDPSIQLRSASNGADGLALLDGADGWRPDVILLDVMMPDMDGPTTLEHIRGRPGLDQTPVIFLTARAQSEDRTRLLGLGAVGVITKPFDPLTLARDIRSLLQG